MGLIDRLLDSGRVVDELFLIIDELRAKVRKLQEEADPVAVVAGETRASKTTQWLDKSQHRETEAQGQMQILDAQLQGLGDNMDLEIKEDPYATLSDDDIVRMEVEVPFNDSDPPVA
ncbi:hypothetical protein GW17_00056821 [Ensete ventricosum]|nr:hypothetical protein GW17_00056821 [Ensete ventricosum]